MDIYAWLQNYGYLALILGSFLEGDLFMLAGAFLASQGHLAWQTVFLIGVFSAVVHGQLCFYLGHRIGPPILARLPARPTRLKQIRHLLHQRQWLLILLYRMVFGLRTIAPVLIGISATPPRRFLLFNTLGAMLWSGCYSALGYLLGSAAEQLFGRLKHDALWLLLAVLLALAAISLYYTLRRRAMRHDS